MVIVKAVASKFQIANANLLPRVLQFSKPLTYLTTALVMTAATVAFLLYLLGIFAKKAVRVPVH